ncbi:MAG: mandelate racemase/muconate lactonizing enzyme family protein [Ignavibacteriaceae bacterium]
MVLGVKLSLPRYEGEKWNRALTSENLKQWAKIIEAVRLSVGKDFPLAVDLHWKYNSVDVLNFTRMIEDYNLWFLEDPLPVGNEEAFLNLRNDSKVPILTGENLYTRYEFRPYIEKQACDYIHPDAQKCGGLLETKKIADWADIYGMGMFCHNGCTPVGTTASAHVCSSIKNFIALESDGVEIPYWQDFIQRDKPFYQDGYLVLSKKPGLGIELNEDVCRKHLAPGGKLFD